MSLTEMKEKWVNLPLFDSVFSFLCLMLLINFLLNIYIVESIGGETVTEMFVLWQVVLLHCL